jgi:hypothetical protein
MEYSREALLKALPTDIAERVSFSGNISTDSGMDYIHLDITEKVRKIFGTIVEKARQVSVEMYKDWASDDLEKAVERVLYSVEETKGNSIALEDGEVEIRFINGKVVTIGTSEWGSISSGFDF